MTTGEAKANLRQRLRARCRALDPAQRCAAVAATRAALSPVLARWSVVAGYASLAWELDLGPTVAQLWFQGRVVWLPRVVAGGRLAWHPLTAADDLVPGAYSILEPDPQRVPAQALPDGCLVLVPGVGFTAAGGRLGQGGGFYDRFLACERARLGPIVGIGFACQQVAALPREDHDAAVDAVCLSGRWVRALPPALTGPVARSGGQLLASGDKTS